MALPVALFGMIASMALAGAAVMATVDVQQGSHRDNSSKSAIAAADAGANIARLRLARYATVLDSETAPCLSIGAGGLLTASSASTDGWCPEVTGTVGGATYGYRVTPVGTACGAYDLCVVSSGTADGVTRRIEVTYNGDGSGGSEKEKEEKEGEEEFEEEKAGSEWSSGVGIDGVIGVDKIQIDENGDVRTSIGTNGNVAVDNNGNVCGNIRHGIGKEADIDGTQCKGYSVTEGNVELPPVSSFMPTDIATNNSNYRLVKCTSSNVPTGCQTDTYSVNNKKDPWTSTVPWNASTRTISTENNATLTLGGGDYFVCKLLLSNNSHLIMADGATVRVFFDTPENCGLTAGAKQIDISNNSDVTATGYQPTLGHYDMPGFYLNGSSSISTMVELSPNGGTNEFILYAPNTEVLIKNNATYVGIIAGKTVHIENATVEHDAGFSIPTELNPWKETGNGGSEETGEEEEGEEKELPPTAIYFAPQSYVECSGDATPGMAPNANC